MEITWCYNERHHGKGPMDGIGGTLKNCVYRDTMSGKCFINTPMEFAEYADKTVKGITSLYLPADEVLVEPDDIEMSPKIKDTLKIHLVKRSFDQQRVPVLKFFKLATDVKPFFTQYYGENMSCGHEKQMQTKTIVVPVQVNIQPSKTGSSVRNVPFGFTKTAFLRRQ